MSDETRRVLDLLAQGKITVDEADRLIKAVSEDRPAETATELGEPAEIDLQALIANS